MYVLIIEEPGMQERRSAYHLATARLWLAESLVMLLLSPHCELMRKNYSELGAAQEVQVVRTSAISVAYGCRRIAADNGNIEPVSCDSIPQGGKCGASKAQPHPSILALNLLAAS